MANLAKKNNLRKIAIDIDNTICYTSDFYGELAVQYDREVLHKNSDIDFSKVVPRSADWTKEELAGFIENIFYKQAIDIPMRKGVSQFINKLKKEGFEIIFITNRGIKEDDHTDLIVPSYLKKNNIPYDEIITKANDKYKFLGNVDYFVDDDIKNCEDALDKTNCKVIMMETDRTQNYSNKKLTKVKNWEEVYKTISNFESQKQTKGMNYV